MDSTDVPVRAFWNLDDPRGLLGQTRAVALMRSDKRASYKHFSLVEFHWGWAHKKHDWTSLASVRRIHAELSSRNPLGEVPLSLQHINRGNRDLCDWGWLFELEKGSGRTASRYLPNFALFDVADSGKFNEFLSGDLKFSVHPVGERDGFNISVHLKGDSGVTYRVNTNQRSVHLHGDKDPLTETGLQDRATEREIECATPTAPAADAPVGATSPVTAQGDGFNRLWAAYSHRQRKADARAAFDKLSPTAELLQRMVLSAEAWFAAWSAQNKPGAPRFNLKTWIEREEYECDPPTAYKAKERKPRVARPEPAPRPSKGNLAMVGEVCPYSPWGTFQAEIYDADVKAVDPFTKCITLKLKLDGVGETYHAFNVQAADTQEEERGRAMLTSITSALGIDGEVEDSDDLLFRPMSCTIGKGNGQLFITYAPAPENDNNQMESAA